MLAGPTGVTTSLAMRGEMAAGAGRPVPSAIDGRPGNGRWPSPLLRLCVTLGYTMLKSL